MTLTLRIDNTPHLPDGGPTEYTVNQSGFEFGRDPGMDWTLPDPNRFVSSCHGEIRFENGIYWLVDVSTNGTFLNGSTSRVKSPYQLQNGDRIQIGHYVVVVELGAAGASPAPSAPFGAAAPAPAPAAPPPASGGSIWDLGGGAPAASSDFDPTPPRPADRLSDFGDQHIDFGGGGGGGGGAASPFGGADTGSPFGGDAPAAPPAASASPFGGSDAGAASPFGDPEPEPAAPAAPPAADPSAGSPFATTPPAEPAPAAPPATPPPAAAAPAPAPAPEPAPTPAAQAPTPALQTPPTPATDGSVFGAAPAPPSAVPPAAPPQPAAEAFAPPPPSSPAPAPSSAPPPDAGKTTGADDFLRAICNGAGLPPTAFEGADPGQVGHQIGQAMRIMATELANLLRARQATKQMVRSGSRTMLGAEANNPLKFIPTAEEALETMFGKGRPGYMGGAETVQSSFRDIQANQYAVNAALQPALARLIEDLRPEAVEAKVEGGRFSSKSSEAWKLYVERWNAKTHPYDNGMIDVFLAYFAEAYDDALQRAGGQ